MICKSVLKVNRLIIFTKGGTCAYDEVFHSGVNIIRGKNSSGKSTVMNCLFYGLGGDFDNWNAAATQCSVVLVEVVLNSNIVTLRREITTSKRQPLGLFIGSIDEAMKHSNEGWKLFPYQQRDTTKSFSNVLFDLLHFPEVKSDVYANTNITMHQILRLLFIDQESKTDHLFRSEDFDPFLTREATSELLLGVYDDELYQNRLLLKDKNAIMGAKRSELKALEMMCSSVQSDYDKDRLLAKIDSKKQELFFLDNRIAEVQNTLQYVDNAEQQVILKRKIDELSASQIRRTSLSLEIKTLESDISDTDFFISSLEKRVVALKHSIAMRNVLGGLTLSYCPQCLSELEPVEDGVCSLCHKPTNGNKLHTHAQRIIQEISLQLTESKALLEKKYERLEKNRSEERRIINECDRLQHELDFLSKNSRPSTNHQLSDLFETRGKLKQEIHELQKQQELAEKYSILCEEVACYAAEISRLETKIKQAEDMQKQNRSIADKEISSCAATILQKDLSRQKEFETAKAADVMIDYRLNSMSFRGNFNYSASSNTYLKNAIRFALFFASLKLDFMRFPRFIMCDNLEDKGMEEERSQNFQQILVDACERFEDKNFQMIFSTSMIKSELNTPEYCVGDEYDATNKALKL